MSTFVVAGVQMNPILMDKEGNLSLIIQQLQKVLKLDTVLKV